MQDDISAAAGARVTAVVVTFNRRDLLRECLRAVLDQTATVGRVLVIDNLSADGTAEMVQQEFGAVAPQVELHTLPNNAGGAGGFYEGLSRAVANDDCEWLWLMDDDTIPSPTALDQLLRSWERFPRDRKPDVLASKSLWTDGTIHPMNVPQIRAGDAEGAYLAAELGTAPIRTATFVSVLIRARAVAKHGLPIADYFIWGEDVEYTGRILRDGFGVLVPSSVVVHKTKTRYGPVEGSAERFYYFVRNGVWMLAWSKAWTRNERLKLSAAFFRTIAAFLKTTSERFAGVRAICRGLWDSVTARPSQ